MTMVKEWLWAIYEHGHFIRCYGITIGTVWCGGAAYGSYDSFSYHMMLVFIKCGTISDTAEITEWIAQIHAGRQIMGYVIVRNLPMGQLLNQLASEVTIFGIPTFVLCKLVNVEKKNCTCTR